VAAQASEESGIDGCELRFCLGGLDFARRTFAKILNKLQQIYVACVVPGSTGLAHWQKLALTSLPPEGSFLTFLPIVGTEVITRRLSVSSLLCVAKAGTGRAPC
jgi:hypothetical protein